MPGGGPAENRRDRGRFRGGTSMRGRQGLARRFALQIFIKTYISTFLRP